MKLLRNITRCCLVIVIKPVSNNGQNSSTLDPVLIKFLLIRACYMTARHPMFIKWWLISNHWATSPSCGLLSYSILSCLPLLALTLFSDLGHIIGFLAFFVFGRFPVVLFWGLTVRTCNFIGFYSSVKCYFAIALGLVWRRVCS